MHEKRAYHEALAHTNSLQLARQASALGSTRMRDAVVFGYIMHRHALREKVASPGSPSLAAAQNLKFKIKVLVFYILALGLALF